MVITDVKTLRQCLKVAELRSLSRAAEALNIAQPWLSTRIRNYELALGFEIFDRTRRQLALTPEGEVYLAAARQFDAATVRFVEATRAIALRATHVELHVGCPSAGSGVEERNELIAAFRQRHGEISIRIRLLSIDQIVADLAAGLLDLGFLLDPVPLSMAGTESIALRRQFAVIFMPTAWKGNATAKLQMSELEGREIAVMPETYHPELCTPIYADLRAAGAKLVEMADDNFVALHSYAVKQGIGALTVDTFADTLAHYSGYASYQLEGENFQSNLSLVAPRPGAPDAAHKFWRFASQWRSAT